MRIKEFAIRHYGPLRVTEPIQPGDFSLVFGKNDDGKTLTIDALVKLLFKERDRNVFAHLDRVDEEPDGYLIFEHNGTDLKLPEKGDLESIVGLSSSEFGNIFIIRNSDLSIPEETEFYKNVTDRLTGLRSEEISSIKKQLQKLGILTRPDSSAVLSDDKTLFGNLKAKSRVEHATELIETIEKLQVDIKRQDFDKMEQEVSKIQEKLEITEQEIRNLEDARRREIYEKCSAALETLEAALSDSEQLVIYNDNNQQLWRDCERDIDTYGQEEKEMIEELAGKEEELKGKTEELREKRRMLRILEDRKKKIDEEIRPEIKNYEMKKGDFALKQTRNKFLTTAAIISAIALLISLFGIIIRPSLVFHILFTLFLTLSAFFGACKFLLVRESAWLAGMFERIKLGISRFELSGENIEEILSNIQEFDENYSEKNEELKELDKAVELLKGQNKMLKGEDIPKMGNKIRDAQGKIDNIRRKSRVESLREYNAKLKVKDECEKSINKQVNILETHFGSEAEELQEKVLQWKEKINALEEYKDKAKGTEYSEKGVSELEDTQNSLSAQEEEIRDKMKDFSERLRGIERKANEILPAGADYLHCNTSVDLDAIKVRLRDFVNEVESNRDNTLEVMKIFEEIQREEEEKVSDLFGKESPITEYFCEITGGIYENVEFETEEKQIQITLRNEKVLSVEKLLGGAYDQLYLSVRLALGEALLKGEKGFFIMDDPFVKADIGRLKKQLDMLKKISESGWQIMYFTAKAEVEDALKGLIESGEVTYLPIQGIFS